MARKTSIAAGVDLTAKRAAYDAVCKRLLSEKIILAWIMRSCLDEYRNIDVNTIAAEYIEGRPCLDQILVNREMTGTCLQSAGQVHTSLTEGDVYFDIYFNAAVPGKEESVQLIINVEAQRDFYPGYPLVKRGLYYCARMLSAQKGSVFSHSDYGRLRKVYSIWLCLRPPKYLKRAITDFHIAKNDIIGHNLEITDNYDLLRVIMLCLDDTYGLQGEGIIKLLSVLLSDKIEADAKRRVLREEFNIPMTQELETGVRDMFEFSKSLVEESEARGEARGEARSEARGIKMGIEQTVIASIQSLMTTLKLSAQEAMNALRIPESEQPQYLEKLAR